MKTINYYEDSNGGCYEIGTVRSYAGESEMRECNPDCEFIKVETPEGYDFDENKLAW